MVSVGTVLSSFWILCNNSWMQVPIGHAIIDGGLVPDASVATFVGSKTCAGCHRVQAELWQTSQHKHAMDHANEKSVLGDFSDATFDYYGVKSRFFRKDGKFFVETDGPDGKLAVFEVKYTFGIDPLQQYFTRLPSECGLLAPQHRRC